MKAGQEVTFVYSQGRRSQAVVAAVTGAGASGYKVLSVTVGSDVQENVPHVGDREPGSPFWALPGESIPEEKTEVKELPAPSSEVGWRSRKGQRGQ